MSGPFVDHRDLPRLLFLSLALALGGAGPSRAQDADCVLDHCADKAPAPERQAPAYELKQRGPEQSALERRRGRAGDFDFYVLALSWSPGFCELKGGDNQQCEPGAGLGFVVHGLWPQYERGFPSDCPGPTAPSRIALERANGVFPSVGLARYEWRKHGTCTGRSPSDYFADVARAREGVVVPQPFEKPTAPQSFVPIDIQRAFLAANPRLRPGMMAVGCRRGLLEDVKICLSKDLREFRACPEVVRSGCRAREISVPAPN